jgi:putative addiction module killer protein
VLALAFSKTGSISVPSYRVYFGRDGETLVILLGGGTKKQQDRDIATAQEQWNDYKKRKPREK